MKNAINYYYNLMPDDVHQNDKCYYFEYSNDKYILEECRRTVEEVYQLYNLSVYFYNKKINLHQLILNINNELVTKINDKSYVLMKVLNKNNKKIDIDDLKNFYNYPINSLSIIDKSNWHDLWIRKVDYVEYEIDENKKKYTYLLDNLDFFIGITENAIQLLREKVDVNLYISHIRINPDMQVEDLYNPLNIVVDNKARDIGEYVKSIICNIDDLEDYIRKIEKEFNLSSEELKLLFIRVLFPSSYFDLYENILDNKSDDNRFSLLNNQSIYYEKKINQLYNYLYNKKVLPQIEWLKKI